MRILFGGTFDPVHNGHLHAARAVSAAFGGEAVHLFATPYPPHKSPRAVWALRQEMLRSAVADDDALIALNDVPQAVPTLTIDVLEHIGPGTAPLVWVIGSDGPATFETWHRYPEISKLCHLFVLRRINEPSEVPLPFGFRRTTKVGELRQLPHGAMLIGDLTTLPVSSTLVRDRIGKSRSVDSLLPEPVASIIREQNLYR